MAEYTITRRVVMEQTILVFKAKSKADAIRQIEAANYSTDIEFKDVDVISLEFVRAQSPKSWTIERPNQQEGQ